MLLSSYYLEWSYLFLTVRPGAACSQRGGNCLNGAAQEEKRYETQELVDS